MYVRASLLLASLFTAMFANAAPAAEPWPFWQSTGEANPATIEHGEWQTLLDRYVVSDTPDGINRFRYAQVDGTNRRKLDAYLTRLADIDPRDRDQESADPA